MNVAFLRLGVENAIWARKTSTERILAIIKPHLPLRSAPLAQLDRASGYEPEGREFESLRARHSARCSYSQVPLLGRYRCRFSANGFPYFSKQEHDSGAEQSYAQGFRRAVCHRTHRDLSPIEVIGDAHGTVKITVTRTRPKPASDKVCGYTSLSATAPAHYSFETYRKCSPVRAKVILLTFNSALAVFEIDSTSRVTNPVRAMPKENHQQEI